MSSGALADGVGTGAGCAARARSGCGFDAAGVRRCLRSHALLPDFLLERRLDAVEVIGHALALGIVSGLGMRALADRLGVPMTTAREWRRRFQLRAPALAAALVAVAVPGSSRRLLSTDGEAAALEALGAAWQRARTRFGERVPRCGDSGV